MRASLTTIVVLCALALSRCVAAADMYPITKGDKKFLAEIVDAVRKKDAAWLASHMVYPLSLLTSNATRIVKTKEEFTPILARKLTESIRSEIAVAATKPPFK